MIANSILGGANLHNEVATAFQMIRRKPALPRIQPASSLGRAKGQGAHRGRRDRSITHAADVDDGPGMERMLAITLADNLRRGRQPVPLQYRESDIDENDRAR